MLPEYSLKNKVAIVTGAGRGLGKAIALAFAEAGASLALASRTKSELDQTASEAAEKGAKAIAVPTDVTQEGQVESMVQRTIAELGKIDILVNDVGWTIIRPLLPVSGLHAPTSLDVESKPIALSEWNRTLELNLTSVFLTCRAVGPHMIAQKSGKIINITSGEGIKATPYLLPYSAAKAGVAMFSRCLALEWGRYGINVNAIAPGLYPTQLMLSQMDEKAIDRVLKDIPFRRMGDPRDVALAALYFASDASRYVTGQHMAVDGGGTAR